MSRPCLLLALIIALAGTPLRLAEAASDLARLMDDAGEIEVVDGGVGDDPGETIRADVGHDSIAAMDVDLATGLDRSISPSPRDDARRAGQPRSPLSATPTRRYLLFRKFLC